MDYPLVMSNVQVMFVKNDKVYFVSLHYRAVIRLFETEFKDLNLILANTVSNHLDAGYMVVDLDRGEVINRQLAFSERNLDKKPLLWADTF